jgi:hypothetical protein
MCKARLAAEQSPEAQVPDLDTAIGIQEDVLRFDVPMQNTVRVQVLESRAHLDHHSPNGFFIELYVPLARLLDSTVVPWV